jgi:hypothetical protein
MKRAAFFGLLASLFSLFLLLPAKAVVPQPQITSGVPAATQNPAARNWKRYHYDSDGFSVEFPAEPTATPNDNKSGTRYFVGIENDNLAYFAEVAQLSADLTKAPQQIFEDYAKGSAKGTKSEIKSQKAISLRGYPGSEFVLESDTLFLHFRLFLVGKKLYQVLAVASKDRVASSEWSRFLDSFELNP